MAVTITAVLVSADSPQPVQVVVNGLTAGAVWSVVGTTADGSSWPVPGGSGTADGSQIVLVDNRGALNVPITYLLTSAGSTHTAAPVVVAFAGRAVIQSLDGQTSVRFVWRDNELPRDLSIAAAAFDVPGRDRPPVRYVPGGAGSGSLEVRTDRENSALLESLLKSGRPLIVRTDGQVRDFPAVELILPQSGSGTLWGARDGLSLSSDRVWTISYLLVDDPEPGTALSAFTWDDFDAAMATRTWGPKSPADGTSFDELFAALTWNDFDPYDWDQL